MRVHARDVHMRMRLCTCMRMHSLVGRVLMTCASHEAYSHLTAHYPLRQVRGFCSGISDYMEAADVLVTKVRP